MEIKPYAITISHQIGSGGAYLGRKLSERLGIPFLDHEILERVARQLEVEEADLENREERLSTFWQAFSRMVMLTDPYLTLEKQLYIPSDESVFNAECTVIQRIANENPAIFLGRCGWYVLRNHPRHVSILLTASQPFRIQRLCELYQRSETDIAELIKANDQERGTYIHAFTKQNWLDARHYNLCIDTSAVGLDHAVELAEKCVRVKLQLPEAVP